ncbi:helix-turn-helix transcriptional regulator [Siminovitchia sediminis]|uniref:Helix-turn-helix transcriptional regulator n=1 Tax=Siminovitchia sediminis TaxID=1274353 RepID=A0ABW4KBK2_9BACI
MMNLMMEETDESNQLSMKEIAEKLKLALSAESEFDPRAIKRDLDALDKQGFEIITNKTNYGKVLYSHQHRLFETYQLRMLVDAVLSARFITEKDKKILIRKLKKLTSKHIAKTLPDPLIFNPSSNMDYHLIKINIDRVHEAISNSRVLEYQYGKYNVDKEFAYNRDGAIYRVEPYALIWQNDYYYLIGKFQQTNEFRHYRLDRIRNIRVTEKKFRREDLDITKYVDQSFHMFAGEEALVRIQFKKEMINIIIDRFGLDADIRKLDDEHILLTTKAKISSGLVSWIMRWGHKAKVLSPKWLVDEVKKEIMLMQELY